MRMRILSLILVAAASLSTALAFLLHLLSLVTRADTQAELQTKQQAIVFGFGLWVFGIAAWLIYFYLLSKGPADSSGAEGDRPDTRLNLICLILPAIAVGLGALAGSPFMLIPLSALSGLVAAAFVIAGGTLKVRQAAFYALASVALAFLSLIATVSGVFLLGKH